MLQRQQRLEGVQSQVMNIHKHDFGGHPDAKLLLREIDRWTKKLSNCQAELTHRRLEYLHVLAGGELLDDSIADDFDSDKEHDYPTQKEFISFTGSADELGDIELCNSEDD